MTKLTAITAAMMLGAGAAMAQPVVTQTETVHVWSEPGTWWENHFVYVTTDLYTAYELSLDGFWSWTAAERNIDEIFDTDIRGGRGGIGAGLNYFITRELGISADFNAVDNRGNFVDYFSASGILRFPIDPTGLAPYIFGGGGRWTEPVWQNSLHAGVGLEYRFNPITGLFADARYIWNDKTTDALIIRTGLRFVF